MNNIEAMLNDQEYYLMNLKSIRRNNDFITFHSTDSSVIGADTKTMAPGAEEFINSIMDNPAGYTLICYGRMFMVVRGMSIMNNSTPNVQPVMLYYRTEQESKDYHNRETYGSSAKEWLSRWDDKKSVWSVERGGFGPGYEQALQIAAVEWVRVLINELGDNTSDRSDHEELTNVIRGIYKSKDEEMMKTLSNLGLSGAQDGAAKQLAYMIYIKTPVRMFSEIRDMAESDKKPRMIQISNYFPTL
jgi:hypothetical protein